jgi:hypothetical protein
MSDRKYKQRGYQDSGSGGSERERPRPAAERPSRPDRRDAPRGRGLGAPTEDVFRCARCGEAAPLAAAVARDARCAGCGTDLHTCTNCLSFDTGAHFECRREIPARVSPKDKGNACELFEPRLRREFAREKAKPSDPTGARAAFDALFKL